MTDTTVPPSLETTAPPQAAGSRLTDLIDTLATAIERKLSVGEVAELRRWHDRRAFGAAFWKLRANHLADEIDSRPPARLSELEERWALILSGLAKLVGPSGNGRHSARLHSRHRPLGAALATADWSEERFEALLRSRGDRLLDAVDRMAQFLAQKGEPADWSWAARLVLSDGEPHAEDVRRHIARNYYATLSRQS